MFLVSLSIEFSEVKLLNVKNIVKIAGPDVPSGHEYGVLKWQRLATLSTTLLKTSIRRTSYAFYFSLISVGCTYIGPDFFSDMM